MTGEDHLYHAKEQVWLADVSTNGNFRTVQHFSDALGRETNVIVCVGVVQGEATDRGFAARGSRVVSSETTEYPCGGSDFVIRTDARGKVTETVTQVGEGFVDATSAVYVDGMFVSLEKRREHLGGGTVVRREWDDKWTEESRFTDYGEDGMRREFVVTDSPDYGIVTNSVEVYDWLGRRVSSVTPLGTTSYAYEGASGRVLTSVFAAGAVTETEAMVFNERGETVGVTRDGVVYRNDTDYESRDGEWWEVTREAVIGTTTNSMTLKREQMTGLGNGLLHKSYTEVEGGSEERFERGVGRVDGETIEVRESSVGREVTALVRYGLKTEESEGEIMRFAYDETGRLASS